MNEKSEDEMRDELHNKMRDELFRMMAGAHVNWERQANSHTEKEPVGTYAQHVQQKETYAQHRRRLLKDWEPHFNESSGKRFLIELINLMCKKLRERGLYARVDEYDDDRAFIFVSQDRPGAKEQRFLLKREDEKTYCWKGWRYS